MKAAVAFLVILGVGIGVAMMVLKGEQEKRTLPIYNPTDVNPDLVDASIQDKGSNHHISDFYLQNQDGNWVTKKDFDGQILVVNYFFTTCPGICPAMNAKLMKVDEAYKSSCKVSLLSHTVWPEVDSVSVLKEYEGRYQASTKTWHFLTGDKKHLYELARKSYLVCPDVSDPNYTHGSEADFIHSEIVVLVDTKGRIRGRYDGTSDIQIENLIEDIQVLMED